MNKWQIEGGAVKKREPGYMVDTRDRTHYSIHPHGTASRRSKTKRSKVTA